MNVHVDDRINAYLDGELTDSEAALVNSHVETCEHCAAALREARAVMQMLEGAPAAEPLAAMWPNVEARLGRGIPAFDLPFAAATAAALAMGVMLGVLTFDRQVTEVTPVAEVATATDEWSGETELLLADIYLLDSDAEADSR